MFLNLRNHAGDGRFLFGRELGISGDLFKLIDGAAVIGFINRVDRFIDGGLGALIGGLETILELDRVHGHFLATAGGGGEGQEQSQRQEVEVFHRWRCFHVSVVEFH